MASTFVVGMSVRRVVPLFNKRRWPLLLVVCLGCVETRSHRRWCAIMFDASCCRGHGSLVAPSAIHGCRLSTSVRSELQPRSIGVSGRDVCCQKVCAPRGLGEQWSLCLASMTSWLPCSTNVIMLFSQLFVLVMSRPAVTAGGARSRLTQVVVVIVGLLLPHPRPAG